MRENEGVCERCGGCGVVIHVCVCEGELDAGRKSKQGTMYGCTAVTVVETNLLIMRDGGSTHRDQYDGLGEEIWLNIRGREGRDVGTRGAERGRGGVEGG
jgi:hypothetical protein